MCWNGILFKYHSEQNGMEIACSVCISPLANSSHSTEFHTTISSHQIAKQFLKSASTNFSCIRIQWILKMMWIQIRLLLFIASECWWKSFTCIFWISRIGWMPCDATMHLVNDMGPPEEHTGSFSFTPPNIACKAMMVSKELLLNFT